MKELDQAYHAAAECQHVCVMSLFSSKERSAPYFCFSAERDHINSGNQVHASPKSEVQAKKKTGEENIAKNFTHSAATSEEFW